MNQLSTADRARIVSCLVEGFTLQSSSLLHKMKPQIESSPLPSYRVGKPS